MTYWSRIRWTSVSIFFSGDGTCSVRPTYHFSSVGDKDDVMFYRVDVSERSVPHEVELLEPIQYSFDLFPRKVAQSQVIHRWRRFLRSRCLLERLV